MSDRRRWIAFALVVASCSGRSDRVDRGDQPPTGNPTVAFGARGSGEPPDGLVLRLSNGALSAPVYDRGKLAATTALGDAEVAAVLARAKALLADPADPTTFALRPATTPPPQVGETIAAAFPPPPSSLLPPPSAAGGNELHVLRSIPQGAVAMVPQVSVTFDQPMVAVTSQTDAAAIQPVKLTRVPKPGAWRWIGTRTIVFDAAPRLPQATTYTVEVPAGTKSATGAVLAKAATFSFETPPPTMVASYPNGGPERLDVPMYVRFDQQIDPKRVLAAIHVIAFVQSSRGSDPWSLGTQVPVQIELVDPARAAKLADKQLTDQLAALTKVDDGTWFVFRAVKPLPADAEVHISIDRGMPSAEGPNPTQIAQMFQFHTYPPLRVAGTVCGYDEHCHPGETWSINFTNVLDAAAFDPAKVTITPPLPDARITQYMADIVIEGPTQPRTTYKVAIAGTLRDGFEQTLGAPATVTFSVGDSEPSLFGPDGVVVLDPMAAKPTLDYFTTNYDQLKVKLYRVEPGDFGGFVNYPRRMPGTLVVDTQIKTTPGANVLAETAVELDKALHGGRGQVIAMIEPSPWKPPVGTTESPPRMITWVEATHLAIDAHVDHDALLAFASDLTTGKPVAGATVTLEPAHVTATTDERGLATLPMPATPSRANRYVIARHGDDTAVLQGEAWFDAPRHEELTWSVTDDRKMYRPGEHVTLKGWLRMVDHRKHGDVAGLGGKLGSISYKVLDEESNQLATGTAKIDALGAFDLQFTLPKTPNLGTASVELSARAGNISGETTHTFEIQEFRRPEFEVSAHTGAGPFVIGGTADVIVDASYYAGGPLPGAQTSWSLNAAQTGFTPPNRDDFTFGMWQPWWERNLRPTPPGSWQHAAQTDGAGEHALHVDLISAKPAVAYTVTAQVSVADSNHQQWGASTSFVVHPSLRYVGLRAQKPFVEQGTPYDVDVIGVDLDGKAAPGAKIDIETVRIESELVAGKYVTKDVDPQHCAVVAAKDPVPCHLATPHGGHYEMRATITDDKGRPNRTVQDFWVADAAGSSDATPARDVTQEVVQLIPDRKTYLPGATAELLVRSPFAPAEGIVTYRRSGIIKTERITMTKPTAVITVPISDDLVPDLIVQVDLVGTAPRLDDRGHPDPKLPRRPAFAAGSIELAVPPMQRTLGVTAVPSAAKLEPGGKGSIAVTVVDAAGKPVAGAEVTVFVVDEAVLVLSGAQFQSPLDEFYPRRDADTHDAYMRAAIHLAKPELARFGFDANGEGPGGGGTGWGNIGTGRYGTIGHGHGTGSGYGVGGGRGGMRSRTMSKNKMVFEVEEKPRKLAKLVDGDDTDSDGIPDAADIAGPMIAVRSNFDPLAAFVPAAMTGADGKVVVDIKMPDNLTRYRIVAIAAAGDKQFGKGEAAVTARLPLMVRPSPPRFLNFGDTFRLPVVIQNQTDAPMTVKLAIRATNLALTAGAGRSVTVPPNDRALVEFPAAAQLAGTARIQVVGTAGDASDAAELSLPVWTPATTEAFATYGTIDGGAHGAIKQPVALPAAVVTQFGGLEVSTASTNLQSLTDALLYIVHYPFECSEQRASRILAIAGLRDVLGAFHAKNLPSAAAMEQSVAVDLEHLAQMQSDDGGFGFWERDKDEVPYLGVYVANALARAKAKGFAVSGELIAHSLGYLRTIDSHIPLYYGNDERLSIEAFALYTRKLLGDLDVAKAKLLLGIAGDKLSIETAGWVLGTIAGNPGAAAERKALVQFLMNHVSETAGAASFATSYGDQGHLLLASDTRADAVVLESLIQEALGSDLIPKLVAGLLAARKAGRWMSTQDNAFVLLALDRYFHTYEKITPDFVARVWLGNDYAGDHAFHGRTTETYRIDIPMATVAAHDHTDLAIQNDGNGRLYYRVGMTYAPASLRIDPADYGFVVERRYEAVDDPGDVRRDKDGTWRVKAGARVRIKLSMVNQARRYHVALVDPLPAGFETMNPALAVTGSIPSDPQDQKTRGDTWWWSSTWYEHQNMRDERVEAFASELWEGVHAYDYVARATTAGTYTVPPPKAEEMYMPETFGRGASDRVIVE